MNPDAHGEARSSLKPNPIQLLHRFQDTESGADRALGVVFVGLGVAEVY